MALSGNINSYISGTDNHYGIRCEWSATQDVANNTSKIMVKVWMLYYWSINIDSRVLTVTIDGTKYQYTTGALRYNGSSATSSQFLHTFTHTVNHDATGNKNFSISVSFPFAMTSSTYGWVGTATAKSGTLTLNTIPRASSIISAGNVTLGDKCNIKWTPLASSFAYKVKLSCGGVTHTSDYITPGSTSAYTYAATMSVDYWDSAMPNSYYDTCTATLYTYTSDSSSSAIGSDTATFTLTLPKNSNTTPSVSFATPILVNGWNGYYIQGKSKCTLSATFSAGAGSSISACSISGTGLSKTGTGTSLSGTTSVLTKSGTFTYTAEVADGRTSASATKSIYVYPYATPTLALTAARTSSSGSVKINYMASCSSINSQNNLVALSIYQKLSTDSTWPASATKIVTLSSTSVNGSITLSGYDPTASYDFKAIVTDTYGSLSTEAIASITSEFRLINVSKDKQRLSIGKMAASDVNEKLFDCAIPARFLDNIEFTSNNGSIYGSIEADYNESGNNIVYIRNGQDVDGGASMALAIHKSSVYVAGDANDGLVSLGAGSRKWNQLYAANGTISTSDQKVKTDIASMSDTQEQLFNRLQPVTYKLKNGTSNRTHYGFISQDVENVLDELELTGLDFAGFCKDLRIDDSGNPILDENGQKIYDYSLRYSEFIALNTYMIQRLQAENAELKAELKEIKEMIANNASSNNVE